MLKEFSKVKQEPGGGKRRWFGDEGMELIIWYNNTASVTGFQICYVAADRKERALTWQQGSGFSHATVESGDTRPDKNMTPILVPDGVVPWAKLTGDFAARADELDSPLRALVLAKLKENASRGP